MQNTELSTVGKRNSTQSSAGPSSAGPSLRPYQADLKADTYAELRKHRSVVSVLPTGGGKTIVLASIIADAQQHGRRTLTLAHRTELIEQAHGKLTANGIYAGIIQAGRTPSPYARHHVGSVQTVVRRSIDTPDLIIIDEAHHATAASYRAITDAYPFAKVIGFTATPCRIGGKGLSDVFQSIAVGPQPQDLVDGGHLVPARLVSMPLRESLSDLKTSRGDYAQPELQAFMERTVLYGDLVSMYRQFANGKRCLTFAASVELSRGYVNEYLSAGIPAAHIDGTTPAAERADILHRLKIGTLSVVSNVAIATEGLDIPEVEAVQIVVATKSLTKYLQMAGRAVRPSPNKHEAVIIDHGGNYTTHGHPQEDRLWSINGIEKRTHAMQYETVEIDLPIESNGPRTGPDHLTAVELHAIDPIDRELQRLMKIAETNDYRNKNGKVDYHWAYRKWREALDRQPTTDELKFIQRRAGYNYRWILHQLPQSNN